VVIDASVWVGYFVRSDPHHGVTREWMAQQLAEGAALVGPGLVLAEVAGAIARLAADPADGKRALGSLLAPQGVGIGLEVVTWEAHEEEEAAAIAADLLLRGADAHYVLAARLHSMPLISWDDQQLARAEALVPVGRPGEPLRRPTQPAS
jgi:predicted nucleic acid-binding protein